MNNTMIKANAFRKRSIFWMILIVIVIPLGLFFLLRPSGRAGMITVLSVAAALLAIYITTNTIAWLVLRRRPLDMKKEREQLFEKKEKLVENYTKVRTGIRIMTVAVSVYLMSFALIIILLNTGLMLLLEYFGFGDMWPVLILVVTIYLVVIIEFLLLYSYYAYYIPDPGPRIFLDPEEYPTINRIASTAKDKCGVMTRFGLFAVPGPGARIHRLESGSLLLGLGIDTVALLTPGEFSAVLTHEFSHAAGKDTDYSFKINRRMLKWQLLSSKRMPFPTVFFMPLGFYLNKTYSAFLYLSSYRQELKADKAFTEKHETRHLVNALAKLDLYAYYMTWPPEENIYAANDFNSPAAKMSAFTKAYQKNKSAWDNAVKNQLPAKLDTHPNLAERMKNLGAEDFEAESLTAEGPYKNDIEKLEKYIGEILSASESAPEEKKFGYTVYAEMAERFRKDASAFTGDDLMLAYAFFNLCDYASALEIYENKLSVTPQNPEAQFFRNLILCMRGDTACINGFLALMDNANYFNNAYLRLGAFLQYASMKKEMDELRPVLYQKMDSYTALMQISIKKSKKSFLQEDQLQLLKTFLDCAELKEAFVFGYKSKEKRANYLLTVIDTKSQNELDFIIRKLFCRLSDAFPDIVLLAYEDVIPKKITKKLLRLV